MGNSAHALNWNQLQAAPPAALGSGPAVVTITTKFSGSAVAPQTWLALRPPIITSLSPASGMVGQAVTLGGSNFPGTTSVTFNGVAAAFVVASGNVIQTQVPAGARTGPITIHNAAGAASSSPFTVTVPPPPQPTIASFSPAQGASGMSVTLTGTNFTGASAVDFNGAAAASGPIRVTNAAGTGASVTSFTVNPLCQPSVKPQSLIVRDLSVVEDARAAFHHGNLAGSHWSFGFLMGIMSGASAGDPAFETKASNFIKSWLNQWTAVTSVAANGAFVGPRPIMNNLVLNPWPKMPNGDLDLAKAPFRLLAIVDRIDLRDGDGTPPSPATFAGEGRFVFGVLDPNGFPLQFTVILEYLQPLVANAEGKSMTVNDWAKAWLNLSALPVSDPAFNAKLQAVTDLYGATSYPSLTAGSAIRQVRTNEIALSSPWELREFHLQIPSAGAAPFLQEANVKLTPQITWDRTADLRNWITANADKINANPPTHVIGATIAPNDPRPFVGGTAPTQPFFQWMIGQGIDETTRRNFSANTCNGCHGGDAPREFQTLFLHVGVRGTGQTAPFSTFLTDDLEQRRVLSPSSLTNLVQELNCPL